MTIIDVEPRFMYFAIPAGILAGAGIIFGVVYRFKWLRNILPTKGSLVISSVISTIILVGSLMRDKTHGPPPKGIIQYGALICIAVILIVILFPTKRKEER